MEGFLTVATEWLIRSVVIVSLGAHIVLAVLASIRRHQRSGVLTVVLWWAYQLAEWAAPLALSKLPTGSTSPEHQLVAFWVPFLLSHLGGPDNITAYSFEDNKLSLRKAASTILQLLGTWSAIYKQVNVGGANRALLWASLVMVAVGVVKYFERASALRKADFGKIRSASKNQPRPRIQPYGQVRLEDEQALLVAHELLQITKGAFADFSVDEDQLKHNTRLKEIFHNRYKNIGWKNMCKVVEMELSLMYDILYTKAAKIHTCWFSYLIRIVSPVATAVMAVLFWSNNNKGSQKSIDVLITYILLVVTFLLEVRWLLRATASTWTYAFFNARPACWLHHEAFCSGRWHRVRHSIISLDPRRLRFMQPLWPHCGRIDQHPRRCSPCSYRLWSGTIGRYNLFEECISIHDKKKNLFSKLEKKAVSEDTWIEYKHSRGLELGNLGTSTKIRELLFNQIMEALKLGYARKMVEEITVSAEMGEYDWTEQEVPQAGMTITIAPPSQRHHLLDVALGFVPDFQELILILHVATEVVLMGSHQQLSNTGGEDEDEDDEKGNVKEECKDEEKCVEAIEAMSNYMTFLAAARPDMLPGLKLRSLFEETRNALACIWKHKCCRSSRACKLDTLSIKEKKCRLASILRCMDKEKASNDPYYMSALYKKSHILSDGIKFAEVLLAMPSCMPQKLDDILRRVTGTKSGDDLKPWERIAFLAKLMNNPKLDNVIDVRNRKQLLELILQSWILMLINVSTRCSADSHAKQLGRGCELTTIVWILGEHASIFGI